MNTVRDALNVVRYDWFGLRIGGRGASMRGLWPTLLVASVLIFAGFFVLGRMTTGSAPAPETSSSQRVAHAAIPGGLHGGSPVAGSVPSAIATPPVQRAPTTAAETPASQSSVGATSGASAPTVVSQPASAPAPTSVPAQASAPLTKSSGSSSTGHGSSGSAAGGSGGGGSGGGSFDSSG
ncbi:MAG TPA: hypothetical protein VK774_02150 [Solirubrobacteraceae bacterium]|nr:hypothetical protein [Solirubrobacteraceae bacterium]